MATTKPKKADPCTIVFEDVILSFEHAFTPKRPKPDKDGKVGEPKFGASGLMEKGTEQTKANMAKWKTAKKLAMQKKWGDDESKWPKLKPEKLCMRDGDLEDYEGYPGHWYISAGSAADEPPLVVDHSRRDITKKDGLIYSGARVNLRVNIWAMDNEHGKRVNAKLIGIQFYQHGTPFGNAGPVDREEAFDDISETAPVAALGHDDDGGDGI